MAGRRGRQIGMMKAHVRDTESKGFNVAMSRAKALCVVIGHPVALEADVYGRQLLAKCLRSGTYRGPTLTKKIQRDAGVLPLDVNESMLEKSELVGIMLII